MPSPVSFDVCTEYSGVLDRFHVHINNAQPVVVDYYFIVYSNSFFFFNWLSYLHMAFRIFSRLFLATVFPTFEHHWFIDNRPQYLYIQDVKKKKKNDLQNFTNTMADNTPSFRPRVRTPRSLVNRSQSPTAESLRFLRKLLSNRNKILTKRTFMHVTNKTNRLFTVE